MNTTSVRLELALVVAAVSLTAAFGGHLPRVVPVGMVFIAGALALLLQGYVRDLARIASMRGRSSTRRVTCICVESAIGVASLAAGAALTFGWDAARVPIGRIGWPLLVGCVGIFGAATREIVFDWRARRFRRETDHGARVVWRE